MRLRRPALVVLLISISVTVGVTLAITQVTKAREAARFGHSIGQKQQTLESGLNKYLTLLDAVRAFTVARINMNPGQFHSFVEALDLRRNYPGIEGLGLAVKILPAQIPELVKKARSEGLPEFQVWPPTDQMELCPLVILEPRDQRNLAAQGYDLFAEPEGRAAAQAATEKATPIATATVATNRTGGATTDKSFVILVPVYKGGGQPETIEERRTNIAGFVYCAFRTQRLLQTIVGDDVDSPIGLRVYDGTAVSERNLFYQSLGWASSPTSRFKRASSMMVAARPWTLEFASQRNFRAGLNPAPITLLSGLILSGMLWMITMSQSRAREAAERHTLELKKSEAALEQRVIDRTADLERAIEELKAFSYTVSHDLRAPLRHIDGYVNLLQENPKIADDTQAQRQMAIISKSAKHMGQLVDGLLNFARIGWTQLSVTPKVEVNEIVRDVCQMLTPAEGARRIEWRIADLPAVTADRTLLQQVFANLISNAVKYTGPRAPAIIEIGSQDSPREITFFVRDNGVGFDMKYSDKLFNVFQRLHTENEFEGTGIGLANIRKIIARHGGRTWAEGAPDQGATFYFTLPKTG